MQWLDAKEASCRAAGELKAQGAIMPHGLGGVAKRGLVDGSRTRECASMIGTWEECVYNIRCVWNYAVRSGALTLAQLAHRM